MYQKSLLYLSYGNYATGTAVPTVRTEAEESNIVAYFKLVVKTKGGQLRNRWLTKDEAIKVSNE
jgi:hypothetical protein